MKSIQILKKIPFFTLLLVMLGCDEHSNAIKNLKHDYPITPVPFTQVTIQDIFLQQRITTNREITVPYTFKKSEETGRIRNFAKAGGLEEGAFEGIFFNDSDVFKIIEGASYSLQVHPDPVLKKYVDDLIFKIAAAQEEDGYLYTNRTIDPKKAADKGGAKRWTSLGIHHELYNVGHMYEGAVAHYQATGSHAFLDVAIKNADLIDRVFGPGKNMGVPGHQEIEVGLVKLYRVTGNKKYLDLAKFFVDQRGNAKGHELFGDYCQDHKPFYQQEKAVGHAVRAGYFYAGATDVAALTGSTKYDLALDKIWRNIVEQKIYLTGGIGAEPKREGFGPNYELPNATAYTETCAAIALMFWNHRLFLLRGEVKYMDVFERTLYNGFLSGISFSGDTFFYPNPLAFDGEYKFNRGACERSPWFDCSCCPVNIVRVLPSLPGYIYATRGKEVFVNLFIGNTAKFEVNGKLMELKQTTHYPWAGKVVIEVGNSQPLNSIFNIRIPGWARGEVMPGDLYRYLDNKKLGIELTVNGKEKDVKIREGYIQLENQDWKAGDRIEVTFEMAVRKVIAHKKVKANKGKIAFERDPLVYCAEETDNPEGVLKLQLSEDELFNFEYDTSLFGGLGIIKKMERGQPLHKPMTLVPYYAWAHRGLGEMAVWLDQN